jgi:predicted enzyme related to lactoylglutathione lyase
VKEDRVPNPVVHFEIVGKDGGKLQQFYRDAFNWAINTDNPMQYGIVQNDGAGIGGGVTGGEQPEVTFYIEVADLAAALAEVKQRGGRVVQEITEIPGMVTLAKFADPEGNVVGLVKAEPQ